MDNYIIITLNMFSYKNQVYIVTNNNDMIYIGNYSIEALPNAISILAHEKNIYNVKISGANKYSQLVEYGIETAEMTNFNERKIKVEVM